MVIILTCLHWLLILALLLAAVVKQCQVLGLMKKGSLKEGDGS
jgi:hypothetical protein